MDVRPLRMGVRAVTLALMAIDPIFADVTDFEPHLPLPRFTHVRLDCWYSEGFCCQIDDREVVHIYRGHGERLHPSYRQLPQMAMRENPYNFIIHVYDQYNRLCRVVALPRTHMSMRLTFLDPEGFLWMHSTEGLVGRLHVETDDPNVFPDLGLRRHNNLLVRP